ncbi:HpcH/HpaI aldolase/citrate lyase family protein [Jatrophihabitans sp. DSM 45814]
MLPVIDGTAWLFCPADRPERFAKAADRADVVILDLEDGVASADRASARRALVQVGLDPTRTVIRINPSGTADHEADLAALARTEFQTVMLAKTESAAQVAALDPLTVVALCETPAGVLAAPEIAAIANVTALMWGAEDLIAAIGGHSSRDATGGYRDVALHARALVLLAAAAAKTAAIDAVYLDIADLDGLAAEAADSVASGFAAKACIHPTQVAVVRDAYRPAADLVDWARRVLSAAETAPGVFTFDGLMVDEPVLRQARAIISRSS